MRSASTAQLDGFGDGTAVSGKDLYAAAGTNRSPKQKKYRGYGHKLEIFDISDVKNPRKTGMVKSAVNAKPFPGAAMDCAVSGKLQPA